MADEDIKFQKSKMKVGYVIFPFGIYFIYWIFEFVKSVVST